jgi:hypothetical protein
MGCKYIYTDINGDLSSVYYRALEQYGHEKAEEIYIRHMMGVIDIKRSATVIYPTVEEKENNLTATEPDSEEAVSTYVEDKTGDRIGRTTAFLQKITKPKADREFASILFGTDETKESPLVIGKRKQARQLIGLTLTAEERADHDLREKKIDALIKKDPELLKRAESDIQRLWDAQNEYGTKMHDIFSRILIAWQDAYDNQEVKPGESKVPLTNTALYQIVEDIKKEMGHEFDNTYIRKTVQDILEQIDKASKMYNGGKPLRIKSEKRIYTKKFKEPGTPLKGIGGTVDVTLVSEDNGFVLTMDFKTKHEAKVEQFNKLTNQWIGGENEPFNMPDSPENRARAQQLLYAAIYREEYGIITKATANVVVPMFFFQETPVGAAKTITLDDIGSYTWRGIPNGEANVNSFEDVGNDIEPVLSYFRTGGNKAFYDDAREKGIAGVTENWSGKNKDGQANATYLKAHKEPYIKKKLREIRTNKDGKRVVMVFGRTLDVTGMTEEQIVKRLADIYDEQQKIQGNIAKEIISFFKNPDKVSKTIIDRRHSISKLLQGFSPETHTMELAQNDPELAGIGPDVIIVRHKKTGTISLLSAIIAENMPVKFESDDSKDKRTSLLGKYVTDKMVASNALDEELMTEPKVHDYIQMKLGLAALYLNRKNGTPIAIDRMRVATVSTGNKYTVTSTNLEQEVNKLNQLSKVAGEDFPDEYRELLADINKYVYTMPTGNHLESLMKQMADNTDPLSMFYKSKLNGEIINLYESFKAGDLVGYELKEKLGKYLESVASRLKVTKTDEEVLRDPRFLAVSRALLELQQLKNDLGQLASERINTPFTHSAITSGDKIMMKLQTLYVEASSRIRKDMDSFGREHKRVLNALLKENAIADATNTELVFKPLYKKSDNPEDRMILLNEDDPEWKSLTDAQKNYIKFFNDNVTDALMRVAPERNRQEIADGVFWHRGNVPILERVPHLLTKRSLSSWTALRDAWAANFRKLGKKTSGVRSILEYDFGTRFDAQATDSEVGNSSHRRRALGIMDLNAPEPMAEVETNLAFILNLAQLEASEKENFNILLQTVTAAQALLTTEGEKARMTEDMLKMWREMVIFGRYKDEVNPKLATGLDAVNKTSSNLLFAYSLAQAMTEFSTGTMQNASSLISNMIQNAVADFIAKDPDKGGRFTAMDWAWATKIWNKYDQKIEQMVRDGGILQYDPNDEQTEEFKGLDKARTFASKSGYWLNRLFFNSALTHTYIAQMRHQGITDAYVKKGDFYEYDEELDKRFFVYDKEAGLGDRAPVTDEEKKKHSLWLAVRKKLSLEGMIDQETKRMKLPMTAAERAEIKTYGTRVYGSFNNDTKVHGEALSIGRAMFRYKKWLPQRMANYWTPTIKDAELYGHWQYTKDPQTGEDVTVWVGDDFQGIIQTLGHMATELYRTKSLGFMGELNKYQRENLSKLMADLFIALFMAILILPWLLDEDTEVDAVSGEDIKVKGEFGKSQIGQSMHKGASNALADMALFLSAQSATSSLLPGAGVFFNALKNVVGVINSAITDEDKVDEAVKKTVKQTGRGRTGIMIYETVTGTTI